MFVVSLREKAQRDGVVFVLLFGCCVSICLVQLAWMKPVPSAARCLQLRADARRLSESHTVIDHITKESWQRFPTREKKYIHCTVLHPPRPPLYLKPHCRQRDP